MASRGEIPELVRQTLATQNKGYVSIIITNSGDDGTFAIDREDFTPETKELTNAMAVGLTQEAHNKFTLSPIGQEITLSRPDGGPNSIADGGPGGDDVFIEDPIVSPDGKTNFENLSDTNTFDFHVRKGRSVDSSSTARQYSQVIGDLNAQGANSEIAQNVERIQIRDNRFASSAPYVISGRNEDQQINVGKVVIQKELGKHAPKPTEEVITLRIENLKNLGIQMLLKGSGELYIPEDTNNFGQVVLAKVTSTVPGIARLGLKVPVTSFEPGRIMSEVNSNYSKPKSADIASTDLLSYGSYNNPLAPFDSIDSRQSVVACGILVGTMAGIFQALAIAFGPKDGLQSEIAGSIFGVVNNAVIPTQNDYVRCVREGFNVFFGLSTGFGFLDTIAASIGSAGPRFNQEPGWYNTILRSLTRMVSDEIAGAAFSAIVPPGVIQGNVGPFTSNSGLNISPPGLSADPTNILNVVRRLTQSRVVGFLNVLANMGDLSLSIKEAGLEGNSGTTEVGPLAEVQYVDIADSRDARIIKALGATGERAVNPAALIYKQHLSPEGSQLVGTNNTNGRALTWGQGTTPSFYILPNSIPLAGDTLGGESTGGKLVSKLQKERGFASPDGTNRLAGDLVESIERELEASYVPFYFHDLRTNEIISFHAFLENMSDNFDAEYNEQSGYGRIGKVLTYRNTNRAIEISFRVVATNPTDFDQMWWKINKLVTMVYPQYTVGRQLEFQGQKFVQPFSQLPSSSPLIRLRLGDVFRSNYSKFNLARLFGLGQGRESFSMRQSDIDRETGRALRVAQRAREIRRRMSQNDFREDDTFYVYHTATTTTRVSRGTIGTSPLTLEPEGISIPSPRGPARRGRSAQERTARPAGLPTNRYKVRVAGKTEEEGIFIYSLALDGVPSDTGNRYRLELRNLTQTSESEVRTGTGIGLELDENSIVQKAIQEEQATGGGGEPPGAADQEQDDTSLVRQFFASDDAENANPIMRAFESTKGRGLAGFIKNIRFDWNDATWNTNGFGKRAPMFCRIDISFAPVHDINPGIDASGFNTAPIYRVGEISDALNTTVEKDAEEQSANEDRFNTLITSVKIRGNGNDEGFGFGGL